jgi:hypothetical protein
MRCHIKLTNKIISNLLEIIYYYSIIINILLNKDEVI